MSQFARYPVYTRKNVFSCEDKCKTRSATVAMHQSKLLESWSYLLLLIYSFKRVCFWCPFCFVAWLPCDHYVA